MPSFREILTASDADLVKSFYRLKPSSGGDFIKKINHAATQLELNHTQLVCALGFNKNIRDLTDILSVIGFTSYKLMTYRRNELFSTDTYTQLDIDNVVDIYSEYLEDPDILATLRELMVPRLENIEKKLGDNADPSMVISYKMEVHSIYAGGIATEAFAITRLERPIGDLRLMIDEIHMIVDENIVPPGNLFFSDYLLPEEKRYLIDSGKINEATIRNRLQNSEISEDERQMLEDFV
jgi:hypothetical protein